MSSNSFDSKSTLSVSGKTYEIFDISKKRISSTEFKVDFSKAVLIIDSNKYKNITIIKNKKRGKFQLI